VISDISIKKFLSHSASVVAFSKVTNSDSIVKRAVTICLDNFQDNAPLSSVITYPLVKFNSSESEVQLVFKYLSKTEEKTIICQTIINSFF